LYRAPKDKPAGSTLMVFAADVELYLAEFSSRNARERATFMTE
jgi:hypothetical protein